MKTWAYLLIIILSSFIIFASNAFPSFADTTPSHPIGLIAVSKSTSQISLTWEYAPPNDENNYSAIKIERSTDGGLTWQIIKNNMPSGTVGIEDMGLAPSTTYTYRVSEISGTDEVVSSATVSATTNTPTVGSGWFTVSTDKPSYMFGDIIIISGKILPPNAYPNFGVSVSDPRNYDVYSKTINVNSNDTFLIELHPLPNDMWLLDNGGEYSGGGDGVYQVCLWGYLPGSRCLSQTSFILNYNTHPHPQITITPNYTSTFEFPVTLTATVTDTSNLDNTPTGNVTWSEVNTGGMFSPSYCTLSSGICTTLYTASTDFPGTITIIASYSGDSTHSGSDAVSSLSILPSQQQRLEAQALLIVENFTTSFDYIPPSIMKQYLGDEEYSKINNPSQQQLYRDSTFFAEVFKDNFKVLIWYGDSLKNKAENEINQLNMTTHDKNRFFNKIEYVEETKIIDTIVGYNHYSPVYHANLQPLSEQELRAEIAKDIANNPSLNSTISITKTVNNQIPSWVKNNAKWWHDNAIGNDDFEKGIQYLIQQKIIQLPPTTAGSGTSKQIPTWLKNNAGWWASGQISDDEFVKGIQFLISNGIIKV